jgi:hypothetical protein
LFVLGLGLVSCSKKETLKLESDLLTNLSLETKAVLAQTDLTAMKQGYFILTNDEQEMLWKAKLTYIIKNDDLSQGQSMLLNKMLSFLEQNGITKLRNDNSIADKFISENADEFIKTLVPSSFIL